MQNGKKGEGGFIIEYTRVPDGRSIKVTAIDPDTGVEATIIAPAKANRQGLAQLAIRKLRYVMRNKSST